MPVFDDVPAIGPQQIWDGVLGRVVQGDRLTLGVVELDANSVVPEHRHENEQVGIVLSGSIRLRVGHESRELLPGATYVIPPNEAHEAHTGPDGAVVIDVFAPVREDWGGIERQEPRPPRWP